MSGECVDTCWIIQIMITSFYWPCLAHLSDFRHSLWACHFSACVACTSLYKHGKVLKRLLHKHWCPLPVGYILGLKIITVTFRNTKYIIYNTPTMHSMPVIHVLLILGTCMPQYHKFILPRAKMGIDILGRFSTQSVASHLRCCKYFKYCLPVIISCGG